MMKKFLRFELRSQLLIFFVLSMLVLFKSGISPTGGMPDNYEGMCICNASAVVI